MVDARDLDGGDPVVSVLEVAEHLAVAHDLSRQDECDLAAPGHDLHGERAATERVAQVVEPVPSGQPGLVGEDMKARVVKPADQRHLPVVPAGEDHDVARSLRQEAVERSGAGADDGTPGGGPLRPAVEGVDQGEEVIQLRPRGRIDEDLLAHARMPLTQRERRVEVTGIEERERVHRWPRPSLQ